MWVARSKLLSPLVKSENEHNAGIVKGGWSGVVSYITWRSGGVSHLFTFCGRTTPLMPKLNYSLPKPPWNSISPGGGQSVYVNLGSAGKG